MTSAVALGLALGGASAIAEVGNTGASWDRDAFAPTDPHLAPTPGFDILYAPSEADDAAFRAALAGFVSGSVDYFDARVGTPSVQQLSDYECVMTWANFAYANNVAFGDNLATYVDGGGQVVLGAFAAYTSGNSLSGAVMGPGYSPVTGGFNHFSFQPYAGDGTTQIHNGVVAYGATFRDILALQAPGAQDGSYADGEIATAYNPNFSVVYANGAGGAPVDGNGPDWELLIANACLPGYRFDKEIVSGNDLDGDDEIDLVVEVGIEDASMYDFKITYFNPGGPPVAILDTVPAEWDATILDGQMQTFDFEGEAATAPGFFYPGALTSLSMTVGGQTMDLARTSGAAFDIIDLTGFAAASWGARTLAPFFTLPAGDGWWAEVSTPIEEFCAEFADFGPSDDDTPVEILALDAGFGMVDSTSETWTALDSLPAFKSDCVNAGGAGNIKYLVFTSNGPFENSLFWDNLNTWLPSDTLNCTAEGANKKGNGKSATIITCYPDADDGMVWVWNEARCHGNRNNEKCRPTSCGALYLNDGAAAYELDEFGELIEPPFDVTDGLCLAAVEDVNEDGVIEYDGTGDEDGDSLSDFAEACEGVTDPCLADTDGDGVRDDVDECPLEGPADPALGEILDPNGCIRQSECSDGADNNGDGNVDYPADPLCDDILDDFEGCAPAGQPVCATGPTGGNCYCFATDPAGTVGACVDNYFCSGAADCSGDPSICAAQGRICFYNTGCGFATCGPATCTGVIQSFDQSLVPGGATAADQ